MGSIFILVLLELIYKYAFSNVVGYRLGEWLEKIGNYSLQIYCISVLILSSYLKPISHLISEMLDIHILPQKWLLYDCIITPTISIIYVLIIILIIKILEKTKLDKMIFGR